LRHWRERRGNRG